MTALDPIELRVITGALRAACEEMGTVLVRAAHSANCVASTSVIREARMSAYWQTSDMKARAVYVF